MRAMVAALEARHRESIARYEAEIERLKGLLQLAGISPAENAASLQAAGRTRRTAEPSAAGEDDGRWRRASWAPGLVNSLLKGRTLASGAGARAKVGGTANVLSRGTRPTVSPLFAMRPRKRPRPLASSESAGADASPPGGARTEAPASVDENGPV